MSQWNDEDWMSISDTATFVPCPGSGSVPGWDTSRGSSNGFPPSSSSASIHSLSNPGPYVISQAPSGHEPSMHWPTSLPAQTRSVSPTFDISTPISRFGSDASLAPSPLSPLSPALRFSTPLSTSPSSASTTLTSAIHDDKENLKWREDPVTHKLDVYCGRCTKWIATGAYNKNIGPLIGHQRSARKCTPPSQTFELDQARLARETHFPPAIPPFAILPSSSHVRARVDERLLDSISRSVFISALICCILTRCCSRFPIATPTRTCSPVNLPPVAAESTFALMDSAPVDKPTFAEHMHERALAMLISPTPLPLLVLPENPPCSSGEAQNLTPSSVTAYVSLYRFSACSLHSDS